MKTRILTRVSYVWEATLIYLVSEKCPRNSNLCDVLVTGIAVKGKPQNPSVMFCNANHSKKVGHPCNKYDQKTHSLWRKGGLIITPESLELNE